MILQTCNQDEYAHLPPSQIVPKLADKGIYIASEASFYRVLKANSQQKHRGRQATPGPKRQPTTHRATGPNQLWSWDITYCPTKTRGLFYYLYMIEDVYSRKIVGWEIHTAESGEYASELMQKTAMKEKCFRKPLVLHSDNGSPMKSSTLLSKLQELGITPSRGRPRVSNDNAYSESLFKTMKYMADWPANGFSSIEQARQWVFQFTEGYNNKHCHSGISFVTPSQRHQKQDEAILIKRRLVYEKARALNPRRWSRAIRKWIFKTYVTLNPDKLDLQYKRGA